MTERADPLALTLTTTGREHTEERFGMLGSP
jgi:hypothetical protein